MRRVERKKRNRQDKDWIGGKMRRARGKQIGEEKKEKSYKKGKGLK